MAQPNIPYREAGAHTGLPFPRKGMTAYIVATAITAACGILFPLGLIGRNPSSIVHTLKEGGPSMWLLLMLVPIIPILVAILSGLAIRGRRVPPFAIVGFALFPALVAFAGTMRSLSQTGAALAGESVDPGMKMRIAFEGTQEALAPLQFAGAICAFALGAAAVGCAGIAASVDRARVGAPPASTWLFSVSVPVVGLFSSVVVMFVTRSLGTSLYAFGLSLVSLVIVAIVAPLTALASPAFRDWHDPAEQKRMLSAIVCAAACAALALWLLDRTAMLGINRVVLGACSGESVDPSQRARILMEGRFESRAFVILSALHVPSVLLAFAPAVMRGMNKGRSPLGISGALALVLTTIVGLGFYGVEARATGGIVKIAASTPALQFPVDLPVTKNAAALRAVRGPFTVVDPTGTVRGTALYSPDAELAPYEWRTFAADKRLPVARLFALVPRPKDGRSDLRADLLVLDDGPPEIDLSTVDPDVRAMMTPGPTGISLTLDWSQGAGSRPSVTFVSDDTIIVRAWSSTELTLTFGPDFASQLHKALRVLYGPVTLFVTIKDTTTVDALLTVVTSTGSLRPPEVHVVRTP
jgi:hypothetical protein